MKKSLFGYGTTTKPIAKSGGWNIYDDKFKTKSIDEFENNLLPTHEFEPEKSSLEITSPGLKPSHELIKKAKNLMSEYDYFFDKFSTSIWISGTNGKTTTTQMCEFLLQTNGAVAGGNIGTPLANLDEKANIWILETSSFTLHYTKKAYPNIYILLPITQDHLDWHKDFNEYEQDKLSVLKRMQKGSVAILPKKYEGKIKTLAYCIFYENEQDLCHEFSFDIKSINVKEPFLIDAILALSCQKILFNTADIDKINSFKIDHHKIEEFFDRQNRLWVNDTKGTNIDATIAALKRYKDKKIHLILGGVDKGLCMNELFLFMQNLNICVYAIGQTTDIICDLGKNFGVNTLSCKEIKTAVKNINKELKKDEVALLSPATSSFDQFSSYLHRGEYFVQCVKEL